MQKEKKSELFSTERNKDPETESDEDISLSDIECDLCLKCFNNVSAYEQHLKSKKHHQMIKNEKYKKAMKTSLTASEKGDEEDSTEEFHCEVCDKNIAGCIPYHAHINGSIHAKNLKKQRMRQSLKDQPGVIHDIETEVEDCLMKPFAKCSYCTKTFYDPSAYQKHMKGSGHKKSLQKIKILENLKSEQAGDEENDNFSKCKICNKSFSGPVPYKIHLKSQVHEKEVKRAQAEDELKDYFEKDHESGKLVCKECKKGFPDPTAFKLHLDNNTHGKQKTKDEVFTFVSLHPEIAAVKSVQSLASDDENDDVENYQIGSFFLVCKLCHTSFTGLESAKNHTESKKHNKLKQNMEDMREFKKSKKKDIKIIDTVSRRASSDSLKNCQTSPNEQNEETEINDFEIV